MYTHTPFVPSYDPQTVVLSGTIQSADITLNQSARTVRVTNIAAASCYVKIGSVGISASAVDLFIPGNSSIFITKQIGATTPTAPTVLKALSATGTTIIVETGDKGL
jgi:hypothetical protein